MTGQKELSQTARAPAKCQLVPDTTQVAGDAASPDEVIAGLRAANAQLRALLAEKGEIIAGLRAQVAALEARAEALAAPGEAELEELQQAAIVGRTGQAGAEVTAEEDRPQARPPQGPARRHDGADGYP